MAGSLLVASEFAGLTERIDHLFSQRGYRVDVVHTGVECVTRLHHRTPDALILDWDLASHGGATVLAWMRDDTVAGNVPVIVLARRSAKKVDVDMPVVWRLQVPVDVGSLFKAVGFLRTLNEGKSIEVFAGGQPLEFNFRPTPLFFEPLQRAMGCSVSFVEERQAAVRDVKPVDHYTFDKWNVEPFQLQRKEPSL